MRIANYLKISSKAKNIPGKRLELRLSGGV